MKGETTIWPMAAAAGRTIPCFRFPYNHVGDTDPKHVAVETLLAQRDYKPAAPTIHTSDYLFNRAYERASAARYTSMKRIERAHLDHSRVQIV